MATCSSLLLAPAPAAAAGQPPASATAADKKLAQTKYDAAVRLFKAHRYKEALAGFRGSYDVVASPNTHLMIGKALKELGEVVEAYDEFDKAEIEARQLAATEERYASAAETAVKEKEQLRGRVALITVTVRGAESLQSLAVAGREVQKAQIGHPIATPPGNVEVVAVSVDGKRATKQVAATAGGLIDVELDLSAPKSEPVAATPSPAPEPPPPAAPDEVGASRPSLMPYVAVAAGVGVVGFGVFAVFGTLNNSKHDDLEASCSPTCNQEDIDDGKRLQLVANIGAIVGGVGLATAATLFAVDLARGPSQPRTAAVSVGVGPGSIAIRGGF